MFFKIKFQDPRNVLMRSVVNFHYYIVFIISFIVCFALLRVAMVVFSNYKTSFYHKAVLEIVWTLTPALILISVAIPSLRILFLTNVTNLVKSHSLTAIGNQWYWRYLLSFVTDKTVTKKCMYDRYMVDYNKLNTGDLRKLEVDNPVFISYSHDWLPWNVYVTARDVLHSFALPTISLKVDAVPGRVKRAWLYFDNPGIFYGQCSEICGVNHSFMPRVVEVL